MGIEINIDMRFKAVKDKFYMKNKEFDQQVRMMSDRLTDAAEKWIRHEAPHQTGRLKSATRHEGSSDRRRVYVSNSIAPYFKPVIDGHPTLTTDKSRRYWFAILKEKYGGNYQRKTSGPPGQVPANDYIKKAFNKMLPDVERIVDNFHKWLVS